MAKTVTLLTPVSRLSYPNLIEARQPTRDGKPIPNSLKSFTASLIIDAADLTKFKKDDGAGGFAECDVRVEAARIAREEWPGMSSEDLKTTFAKVGWPIKKGEVLAEKRKAKGKDVGDLYDNKWIMAAKTGEDKPPVLGVIENGKFKQFNLGLETDLKRAKALFQAGYYVMAQVNLRTSEMTSPSGDKIKYITPYLNRITFVKEGERIGGQSLMDRFAGIEGGASDHNPAAGLDDEIPF